MAEGMYEGLFPLPAGVSSHFLMVGDIRTHYLEAGAEHEDADVVILLHSAEYGARARYSWTNNIAEFAKHFHVYAPDMIGFGETDKLHDFTRQWDTRMYHIQRFMHTLCIPEAHFLGSSFSAGLLQRVAAMDPRPWNIISVICISGGSVAGIGLPDSAASKTLQGYDGTREWMKDLLKLLNYDERWWTDDILDEKWKASIEPGAWEALSVSRFMRPGAIRSPAPPPPDLSKITLPTMIVCGREDELRTPEAQMELHRRIPDSEFKMFSPAKHNSHIEHADGFNKLALDFLTRHSTRKRTQGAAV